MFDRGLLGGFEMMAEPLRRQSRYFFQRSRFFKQMGRTWNNDQFFLCSIS